jgi:acetylornithine/succinyldiaminopimelate/putrescine aminotransferase
VSGEYARELSLLREKYGFLIIADEIQAGIGRTGTFFGFEHVGIRPDIIVVAKPIGGGLPLGAFLGNERVADVFSYGAHGTTFGGNPVACAAGIVVFDEIVKKGLMKHASEIGTYLTSKMDELRKEFPAVIRETRGHGCMIGIDLHQPAQGVVDELQSRGILANCTHDTVIRLLPPLIVQREHIDLFTHEFRSILQALKN